MLWSRDGAHNVLQIRSYITSKSRQNDWQKVEDENKPKAIQLIIGDASKKLNKRTMHKLTMEF